MTQRPVKETRPLFAFVMPAYNAQDTIARAIESVIAQEYPSWQLVVCDDGSTDGTKALVEAYAQQDSRITVFTQKNAGCGAARDVAVQRSRAPWIVRFDADDELLPTYLSRMHAFMEASPGYDIYSCNGIHRYPDGTTRRARPGEFYDCERSFTFEEMLFATHIFTIALYSRALYDRVGGISRTEYCEDLEFWLRALSKGATHRYTPQELAYYTVSDTQMTADFSRVVQSRVRIYQSLIDSGDLSPRQIELTHKAIEKVQQDEVIFEKRSRLMGRIERLFGPRIARGFSSFIHVVGQPFRGLFGRRGGA